ncbi:protein phosphatase 2C domain-containing protein [Aestuariimicrobium sp. Y1814]|uniref:protein phosphatase 2C domain-containing protein n=1 Tax=Aestuariimicrobium sp. Y1814 TaxID=3418742 RepID=UPI003DA75FF9
MYLATPTWTSAPARADHPNEDAVRVGPGWAVVIDGAGVEARYRVGCHHSVAWYSHHLADALARRFTDRATEPRDALAGAIGEVRGLHAVHGLQAGECDFVGGSPSATVAAFRVVPADQPTVVETLVLCDAAVLLLHRDGSALELTDRRIEATVTLVAEHRRALRTQGADEAAVFEQGRAVAEGLRNHPDGFWVAREDPAVARHALVTRTDLADLRAVVACSDGITRAHESLGLHTPASLAEALAWTPLDEVVAAIRAAEAQVPHPAGKRHDDATAAVLVYEPPHQPPTAHIGPPMVGKRADSSRPVVDSSLSVFESDQRPGRRSG